MRIVLNTHVDNSGSQIWIHSLFKRLVEAGMDATLNDWQNYNRYDVAVFMGYDHDMTEARRQNPDIRIGLADPKQSELQSIRAAKEADFVMVSSIEQRDVFYRLNRNVLILYTFPLMPSVKKVHQPKEPIILGYHGNRVHLECMFEGVQIALNELAKRRKIEFWAIYNIARLGEAKIGVPDPSLMRVRHIQWSPEMSPNSTVTIKFYEELAHVDIGIVSNAIPIRNRLKMLEHTAYRKKEFMYEPFDHLIRYKASCNPGRIYPFAQLGIPVVSDFSPSASQFIRDGQSGFIVSSPYAWLEAFETLADSPELRNKMAYQLRSIMDQVFNNQLDLFINFCKGPLKPKPIQLGTTPSAEDELGRMKNYRSPSDISLWRRIGIRMRQVKNVWHH